VSLTEAGRLLLRHADGIIARLHAAQADLAAFSEGAAGMLRVGTYQSVGARVLPEVLRRFTSAWPEVEIRLTESTSDDELARFVERGELDVAFVMLPLEEGPFETLELLRDPYVLLVQAGSPLAARETPPTPAEIAEHIEATAEEVLEALKRPEVASVLVPESAPELLELDLVELTYGS
jgi:DNA-binding transcriptional LysR family regulator